MIRSPSGDGLDLARDYLDRADPAAFESVLRYDLPGRDRVTVAALSAKAIEVLQQLRSCLAGTWAQVERLDEASLAAMDASGSLRALEGLDYRSAVLLAWADLYHTVTADMPARSTGRRTQRTARAGDPAVCLDPR